MFFISEETFGFSPDNWRHATMHDALECLDEIRADYEETDGDLYDSVYECKREYWAGRKIVFLDFVDLVEHWVITNGDTGEQRAFAMHRICDKNGKAECWYEEVFDDEF